MLQTQTLDYIYLFAYYICFHIIITCILYKFKEIVDTIAHPSFLQNTLCFLTSSEFIRSSVYREKTYKLIDTNIVGEKARQPTNMTRYQIYVASVGIATILERTYRIFHYLKDTKRTYTFRAKPRFLKTGLCLERFLHIFVSGSETFHNFAPNYF